MRLVAQSGKSYLAVTRQELMEAVLWKPKRHSELVPAEFPGRLSPMRILQVASEVHPYSKTGGLADMVGSLSRALARRGHQVDVITPAYRGILTRFPQIRPADWRFNVRLGNRWVSGEFWREDIESGLTIWFVDMPEFFDRAGIYNERQADYPDNAARFIFFSKAAQLFARYSMPTPDLVHCHDWQTGLLPGLLHHARISEPWVQAPPTLMTIHNLAYQGWFPMGTWDLTNIPWSWFHSDSAESHGQVNFLKAGLHLANAISTVSPRYAREICTAEFGCGLDYLLRRREYELTGILNGVDYDEWNTSRNPFLRHAFSVDSLDGKFLNKTELQRELGLPVRPDLPLFATVSRLTSQKGSDFQLHALQSLRQSGAEFQFVLLGSGDPGLEQSFKWWSEADPQAVAVRLRFDGELAHRIEAGADFFVMPSRFEPCGLNQLYSLRYGTLPIVRATGGLDDSVVDSHESPDHATGIKFLAPTAADLSEAIHRALKLYREPGNLASHRRNAMLADFSWVRQAAEYETLFAHVAHEARRV